MQDIIPDQQPPAGTPRAPVAVTDLVRLANCPQCWQRPGRPCTVSGTPGDHLARCQRAERRGPHQPRGPGGRDRRARGHRRARDHPGRCPVSAELSRPADGRRGGAGRLPRRGGVGAARPIPPGREWMLRLASVLGDLLAAHDEDARRLDAIREVLRHVRLGIPRQAARPRGDRAHRGRRPGVSYGTTTTTAASTPATTTTTTTTPRSTTGITTTNPRSAACART